MNGKMAFAASPGSGYRGFEPSQGVTIVKMKVEKIRTLKIRTVKI
jgi:hypothetical protein